MNYGLPTSVEIGGAEVEIRSDFRTVLDIIEALNDPEYSGEERAIAVMAVFYPNAEEIALEHWQEAIDKCFWFINGGEEEQNRRSPKLVDWQQDFPRIVAPINRVMGVDVRSLEYWHWWSFLAAFLEIGDCLFAQIVNIRNKKARGKPLDKQEREFYNRNRQIIDLKKTTTQAEDEMLAAWLGK